MISLITTALMIRSSQVESQAKLRSHWLSLSHARSKIGEMPFSFVQQLKQSSTEWQLERAAETEEECHKMKLAQQTIILVFLCSFYYILLLRHVFLLWAKRLHCTSSAGNRGKILKLRNRQRKKKSQTSRKETPQPSSPSSTLQPRQPAPDLWPPTP